MKRNILAYLGLALFAIAPLLVTIVTFSVAHLLGCTVDEASDHACKVLGLDLGGALYVMAVLGWLTIVTVPLSAIALVGLTIFLAVKKVRNHAAPT
jgi:hypothetical protein